MTNGEIRAFIETYKNVEKDSKYEFSGSQILQIVKALEQQPCDDCVSRQAVLDMAEIIELEDGQAFYCISPEDVKALPPVTPTQGTCKDCRWLTTDEDGNYYCEQTWDFDSLDFDCADFEKRGNLNCPLIEIEERKVGKWILIDEESNTWQCTHCIELDKDDLWQLNSGTPQDNKMDYCPHCGAKMVGAENG